MSAPLSHGIVALQPVANAQGGRSWFRIGLLSAVVLIVGTSGWLLSKSRASREQDDAKLKPPPVVENTLPTVEVVSPAVGGVARVCVQPGSVEPDAYAELYSQASGQMAEQLVDINSTVKAGQLLARIQVPDLERQVEHEAAVLEHEKAKVAQAIAHIAAAEAEAKAARSTITLARSTYNAKTSYRKYRQKQLTRLTELSEKEAIEARVVDESRDQYESAVEAEAAAKESITTAEQRTAAAEARINQAKADLAEAQASVKVAAASLEKARVLVGFSRITAPFDGIITKRNFFPGDFIRSADSGSEHKPLLVIQRTDKMRIIVQVPDRDMDYLDVGDKAIIETDALPGRCVTGTVSRKSDSADPDTRTMHTEIDVPNPDGKLKRGMYGRVTIFLDSGPANSLSIPSAALVGKSAQGMASVRVVRDGMIQKIPIKIASDNGIQVAVLSGLVSSDRVVVKVNGSVDEGDHVLAVEAKVTKTAAH